MNTSRSILVAAILVCISIGAAAYVIDRRESRKFYEFDVSAGRSVMIDGTRRAILVTNSGGPNKDQSVVCTEPSPDALASLSAQASLGAAADGKGNASVHGALTEIAKNISPRTATIQLLRDTTFRACEAYLNGVINEFEYSLIVNHYDRVMISLITLENLLNVDGDPSQEHYSAAAQHLTSVAEDVVDFLEKLLREPRLVTSCLSAFSNDNASHLKLKSGELALFRQYCDATLESYENYVGTNIEIARVQAGLSSTKSETPKYSTP